MPVWSTVLFKSSIFLLVVCLLFLMVAGKGMLKSPNIVVTLFFLKGHLIFVPPGNLEWLGLLENLSLYH